MANNSRKWTEREKEFAARLRYAHQDNKRLSDALDVMRRDRDLYRNWMMALQDRFVEWLKAGIGPALPYWIRNITETRGAGLP